MGFSLDIVWDNDAKFTHLFVDRKLDRSVKMVYRPNRDEWARALLAISEEVDSIASRCAEYRLCIVKGNLPIAPARGTRLDDFVESLSMIEKASGRIERDASIGTWLCRLWARAKQEEVAGYDDPYQTWPVRAAKNMIRGWFGE